MAQYHDNFTDTETGLTFMTYTTPLLADSKNKGAEEQFLGMQGAHLMIQDEETVQRMKALSMEDNELKDL